MIKLDISLMRIYYHVRSYLDFYDRPPSHIIAYSQILKEAAMVSLGRVVKGYILGRGYTYRLISEYDTTSHEDHSPNDFAN